MVWMEGLGQLKKSNDLIRNRTRDFPACSIVPQPTTLPRSPHTKSRPDFTPLPTAVEKFNEAGTEVLLADPSNCSSIYKKWIHLLF
jgi:hypothetical protein